jgi:hypothetical protein
MFKNLVLLAMVPPALVWTANRLSAQPVSIKVTAADSVAGRYTGTRIAAIPPIGGTQISSGSEIVVDGEFVVLKGLTPPVAIVSDTENFGGLVLHNVTVHNVFVNPVALGGNTFGQSVKGPTIGDADAFLTSLFASNMIHILDQYGGTPVPTRRVGQQGIITYNPSQTTLQEQDVQAIVHAAARTFGSGSGTVLNIFTPQGTDVCTNFGGLFGGTEFCNAPDVPGATGFCSYHLYYDFPDTGRVFFNWEPFAGNSLCEVTDNVGVQKPGVGAMANLLAYDTFDVISDPQYDAWYNLRFGTDIAQLCPWTLHDITLAQMSYRIQGAYTNVLHACVWSSDSQGNNQGGNQ